MNAHQSNSATNNSSFPKLTPSPSSQILIHPEHLEGKLLVNASTTIAETKFRLTKTLLLIVGLISSLLITSLYIYFIPRSQSVSFANTTSEVVTQSNETLEKLNASVESLYNGLTNSEQSPDPKQGNSDGVLGVSLTQTAIFSSLVHLRKSIFEIIDQNFQVKGLAVPATDPSAEYRNQRTLAENILTKAGFTKESLNQIEDLTKTSVPVSAEKLKIKLKQLKSISQEYLIESQKTAGYYIAVSDASIELTILSSITRTVADLETGIAKLTELKKKFSDYKNLPKKIDSYNNDLVKAFDLLGKYYSLAKLIVLGQKSNSGSEITNLSLEIDSLSSRASSDQISFWQNNKSLANYDKLSEEYSMILELATKVRKENQFLF